MVAALTMGGDSARRYNGGKSVAVSAAHLLHRRIFRHSKKCLIRGNSAVTPRDNCCDSGTSAVILGAITAAAESPTLQQLTNQVALVWRGSWSSASTDWAVLQKSESTVDNDEKLLSVMEKSRITNSSTARTHHGRFQFPPVFFAMFHQDGFTFCNAGACRRPRWLSL